MPPLAKGSYRGNGVTYSAVSFSTQPRALYSQRIDQCIDCVSTSTPSVAGYKPRVTYESILKNLTYAQPWLRILIGRSASHIPYSYRLTRR